MRAWTWEFVFLILLMEEISDEKHGEHFCMSSVTLNIVLLHLLFCTQSVQWSPVLQYLKLLPYLGFI